MPKKWNLYEDGITQSLLGTFLSCPEKAKLTYQEGLFLVGANTDALEFGNFAHAICEGVYGAYKDDSNKSQWDANYAISQVPVVMNDYYGKKLEEFRAVGDMVAIENHDKHYKQLDPVMKGYFQYWDKDWEIGDWLGLEIEFDIPIFLPSGNKTRLRGKLDGARLIREKIWLFETKTKGRIEEEGIVSKLSIDLQIMFYIFVLSRLHPGVKIGGVIYNIIRRPQLRQGKDESMKEFCSRIFTDIMERPDFYYKRYNGSIDGSEASIFEAEFFSMLDQLERWYNREFHYKNTLFCSAYGGNCPFLPLCGSGEIERYAKRPRMFMELANESS